MVAIAFLFALGFAYPLFYAFGQMAIFSILILVATELVMLYFKKKPISVSRHLDEKLSNGDLNPVKIKIRGQLPFRSSLEIIDEFPVQLQLRNLSFKLSCSPRFEEEVKYDIRPVERGVYQYGKIRVFISTPFGLINRRLSFDLEKTVKVYPSFIQFKKYSFLAISNRLQEAGLKRMRHPGQSNEFEQIREYVIGDDYRKINWRATARKNDLMVNQFQEEKAQSVYCLIDKGRTMQMPFDGLNLIDYAINATLVMSGIAIGKGDKAGILTFSDKIGSYVVARSLSTQMHQISESLYNQKVRVRESDYLRLYKNIKFNIRKRSLFILFTNFDSLTTLDRQIKYLKAIAKNHVLCTVIFDNTEINKRANEKSSGLKELYDQTMAEKLQHDKKRIIKELNKNGIYSILTEPQDLTINTINKYVEMKARGLI